MCCQGTQLFPFSLILTFILKACFFGFCGSSSLAIIYSPDNEDNQEQEADCKKTPVDNELLQQRHCLSVSCPNWYSCTLNGFEESTVSAQNMGVICLSSDCPINRIWNMESSNPKLKYKTNGPAKTLPESVKSSCCKGLSLLYLSWLTRAAPEIAVSGTTTMATPKRPISCCSGSRDKKRT